MASIQLRALTHQLPKKRCALVSVPATALPDETLSAKRRHAVNARLRVEDWTEMARPAFSSPNHVGNIERYKAQARRENPHLDEKQVARQAERLKAEYFDRLTAAAKAAREDKAEIDAIEGTDAR